MKQWQKNDLIQKKYRQLYEFFIDHFAQEVCGWQYIDRNIKGNTAHIDNKIRCIVKFLISDGGYTKPVIVEVLKRIGYTAEEVKDAFSDPEPSRTSYWIQQFTLLFNKVHHHLFETQPEGWEVIRASGWNNKTPKKKTQFLVDLTVKEMGVD